MNRSTPLIDGSPRGDAPDEPRSRLARRLSIAAMFGIDPRSGARPGRLQASADAAAGALERALPAGAIALVAGPSGAGKSTILRRLGARARRGGGRVIEVAPAAAFVAEDRSVIDLFSDHLSADIRLLCACGLAEAPLWLRPARALSEGQRARLALAMAMAGAASVRGAPSQPVLIIADEFASTLDRVTAMALAAGVHRLVTRPPVCRLVVASAHDDLEEWLAPTATLRVGLGFAFDARFALTIRGREA